MGHPTVFLVFAAFAALVSVTMWLDYFRSIDVFEPEKTGTMLLALVIGGCTPYLSLLNYSLLTKMGFTEGHGFVNDLLYAIFGIGLNEELCKLLGVLLVLRLLKKQVNEPIDVLIYAGVTALGFSMVENYYYFNSHGIKIITSRTFYSALEHIINTSIVVYGLYRHQLFKKGKAVQNFVVAFAVAIASHGLFDFFLRDNFIGHFTTFLSVIIYLVGINFWIQMLNNANNYSSFFDYKKIHYSAHIVMRLVGWYGLTLLIAFVNNLLVADLKLAVISFFSSLISDGFLFFIVILRVSRFKIFKLKYFTVRPEFPFYITKNKDEDFSIFNVPIKIRGESYQEYLLTRYLNSKVELHPVNTKQSFLKEKQQATINNKFLLFDDVVVYSVSIPAKDKAGSLHVLKPKTHGRTMINGLYPIEGLFEINLPEGVAELKETDYKKMKFLEWVYLKPE